MTWLVSVQVVVQHHAWLIGVPGVVDLIDDFADSSALWTITDAIDRKYYYLLTRLAEHHKHSIDLADFHKAIVQAARCGDLWLVQWLHAYCPRMPLPPDVFDYAAGYGHLSVVEWLHSLPHAKGSPQAMVFAAAGGHLQMVQWLHEYRTEGCTPYAMNWAAAMGHLEVVQFLYQYRTEGCLIAATLWAKACHRQEVLQWLQDTSNGATSGGDEADSERRGGERCFSVLC